MEYGKENLKKRGLAKSIAVSNFNTEQLKWVIANSENHITANQMNYNILHQIEVPGEMKNICVKEEIIIVAYRPVERGLLAGKCKDKTVLEMAKKYKKTPAQIALNWLISQEIVLPIPKSVEKNHIDENIDSIDFKISVSDIEKLDNRQ